jgi:hypothetical protein
MARSQIYKRIFTYYTVPLRKDIESCGTYSLVVTDRMVGETCCSGGCRRPRAISDETPYGSYHFVAL